jgi:hypothetical protein
MVKRNRARGKTEYFFSLQRMDFIFQNYCSNYSEVIIKNVYNMFVCMWMSNIKNHTAYLAYSTNSKQYDIEGYQDYFFIFDQKVVMSAEMKPPSKVYNHRFCLPSDRKTLLVK